MVKGIIINLYKQLISKRTKKSCTDYKRDYYEEMNYINSLCEPSDDSERSYNQFLCQRFVKYAGANSFLIGFMCTFAIIPTYIIYRIKSLFIKSKGNRELVVTHEFLKDMLPQQYTMFREKLAVSSFNGGIVTKEDKKFLHNIIIKYKNPIFLYKCLVRIASYSQIVRTFRPRYIICSAEYSFTSSILTKYCEEHNILHINVQHGEKTFFIRDSFFRFHTCYIWDDFYRDIFLRLRASETIYIVEEMKIPIIKKNQKRKYCYYLQLHCDDELISIRKNLDKLGENYSLRRHPVYKSGDEQKIFGEGKIEDETKINIWESIAKTEIVISMSSTVLYQAYLLGIKVMIDDITRPDDFNALCQRGYIMLSKPHLLLSEQIIKRKENI